MFGSILQITIQTFYHLSVADVENSKDLGRVTYQISDQIHLMNHSPLFNKAFYQKMQSLHLELYPDRGLPKSFLKSMAYATEFEEEMNNSIKDLIDELYIWSIQVILYCQISS